MVTKAMFEGLSVATGIKLWEAMIRPTLEYAVEVWDGGTWPQAEQIQYTVGRTLLGLYRHTTREVVRGELGWMTMQARREIKLLKFWGKILKMDGSRLTKQVYRQCKKVTEGQRGSFCHAVCKTLRSLGLLHIWASEEIGELKDWSTLVLACVKAKDKDRWLLALQQKSKLRVYKCIKTELQFEEYLRWPLSWEERALYAKLRSGTHQLRIETGRWRKELEAERVCCICLTGNVENESHFLLDCYVYSRLRDKMFTSIKRNAGYAFDEMKDDKVSLLDALLGHGVASKIARQVIGLAVCKFMVAAMRIRQGILKSLEIAL